MFNETIIQLASPFVILLSELAGKKSEVLLCNIADQGRFRVVARQGSIHEYEIGDSYELVTQQMLEQCSSMMRLPSSSEKANCRTLIAPMRENNMIVGCVVVNSDIYDLVYLQRYLSGIIGIGQPEIPERYDDISRLLDNMLEKASIEIGKPVSSMKKADKRAFIKYLDDHGYFQIKKSTDKVMKYLDISKFTLYAHLEEIRSNDQSSSEMESELKG